MLVNLCILVTLLAASESAFQNSRFKSRQGNGAAAVGPRARVRTCSPPRLVNGFVTPLFKGKLMRFDCNKGYSRLGERYSECLSGRWSVYTFPICIKAGCPIVTAPDNGKITFLNAKASAMLFCEPNYETVGNSFAHCNGSLWDRSIGTCRETDNAPATSCDFESESICGWTHDTDHDFDFERRTGYNNKTISMVTGPHADHTIGIPFQGHYMVINTNTEAYTKRARLISPLFRISAQALCFKFYYHMYGVNLGTLRVYMKPESVDMQTVLLEDTESEARNDYVVFEIKGTQGNAWHEGGGFMKPVNESFQIIVEAISGQTRLSDIAFDDVSIMSDGECLEADEDDSSKVQDTKDDDDAAFSVDSCANRCFETVNTTVQLNGNNSLTCSCSADCDVKTSCCPDFIDVCLRSETTPNALTTTESRNSSVLPTTSTTLPSTTATPLTTRNTTRQFTSSTSRPTATSTSRKAESTTTNPITPSTSIVNSTLRMPQKALTTNLPESKTTEAQKDYEDVGINVEGEDEHDVEQDDVFPPTTTYGSDNIIVNERFMMKTKSHGVDVSLIVKASVIAISTLLFCLFVFLIIYKQYKKSTNPLNYKEKQEGASRKADEEFSEIRFLTCDETLDFNLASPDYTTDL